MRMNKKYHYIYKVTHIKTKKIYIGIHSTNNINDNYFANGVYESKDDSNSKEWVKIDHGKGKNNQYIQNALIKYGRKAFKREIIEWCKTRELLGKRESEIVDKEFIERSDTYNTRTGGFINQDFSSYVRKRISKNNPMHRMSTRKKVSESKKEWWTDDRKKNLSHHNPMKKREVAEKHAGKNSSWHGRTHTTESIKKIKDSNKGRKLTKKQKEKQNINRHETWSKLVLILDKKTKKEFNSLKELSKYLLEYEDLKIGVSKLSEIINKRFEHQLSDRFEYTKNPFQDKPSAHIFLRGDIWQVRIWDRDKKKYWKKSLLTKSKSKAIKLAKIEENEYYENE